MKKMIFLFSAAILIFWSIGMPVPAQEKTLLVEIRQRPPEMVIQGKHYSGPLLDIIEEAAKASGFKVRYRKRQFKASLEDLGRGKIDILPRTICTKERAGVIDYIGPIGFQEKEICFLVKPGKEDSIQRFEDLRELEIGVKRGTVYFEQFDKSREIRKLESKDDDNMVKMFEKGRFDAMIILDRKAADVALEKHGVTEYAFAKYKYLKKIGNYYGIPKGHRAKEKLQQALEEMVETGRVAKIYEKYGVAPPVFDPQWGFEKCLP